MQLIDPSANAIASKNICIKEPHASSISSHGLIIRQIAYIDRICSSTLNAILHHPSLQRLESTWRSLWKLTQQTRDIKNIKIRVLSITWSDISRDLTKVMEIDQSEIFNKIYNQEFGMPGGEPYGVLIGDYSLNIADKTVIETLCFMAQISAATFVPFIAALAPESFGLNSFIELDRTQNIQQVFKSIDYLAWKNLRNTEEARFLGLVLPQVLARIPYQTGKNLNTSFPFIEECYGLQDYLWGNASFAFAEILVNSYRESNWFINIRGLNKQSTGGVINDLPQVSFNTDRIDLVAKYGVEVLITDSQERMLSDLGFISLCQIPGSNAAAFFDNYSIQEPKHYTEPIAVINAKISTCLQYMLCACRFAHYIKIIGRDKIGAFLSYIECENFLNSWLINYIAANDDLTADQKLHYPLRDARVQVKRISGKSRQYSCIIHLQPRMQLEQIKSTLILVTQLSPIS